LNTINTKIKFSNRDLLQQAFKIFSLNAGIYLSFTFLLIFATLLLTGIPSYGSTLYILIYPGLAFLFIQLVKMNELRAVNLPINNIGFSMPNYLKLSFLSLTILILKLMVIAPIAYVGYQKYIVGHVDFGYISSINTQDKKEMEELIQYLIANTDLAGIYFVFLSITLIYMALTVLTELAALFAVFDNHSIINSIWLNFKLAFHSFSSFAKTYVFLLLAVMLCFITCGLALIIIVPLYKIFIYSLYKASIASVSDEDIATEFNS
jgi:hypothetical protein